MTTQHLTNCLWQFQQIYNFGAVETKMKHFEVKRWRSQRDRVRSNRPKYFGGHFLTCLWNRWSLPLSHLCYLSCLVVVCQLVFTWIWMNPVTQRSRSQTRFSKICTFPSESYQLMDRCQRTSSFRYCFVHKMCRLCLDARTPSAQNKLSSFARLLTYNRSVARVLNYQHWWYGRMDAGLEALPSGKVAY